MGKDPSQPGDSHSTLSADLSPSSSFSSSSSSSEDLQQLHPPPKQGRDANSSVSSSSLNPSSPVRGHSSASNNKKGCLKVVTDSSGTAAKDESDDGGTHRHQHRVAWGTVSLHSHAILLGDNVCSCGPPVTISWTAFDSVQLDLDVYETSKVGLPRDKSEMLLPPFVREDWLHREAGIPRSVLHAATAQAARERQYRRQSSTDGRLFRWFTQPRRQQHGVVGSLSARRTAAAAATAP